VPPCLNGIAAYARSTSLLAVPPAFTFSTQFRNLSLAYKVHYVICGLLSHDMATSIAVALIRSRLDYAN